MGETTPRLESLSGEARAASLVRSHPGFWVAGQAPVEDVPRLDGQRGECGTIRGLDPVRESAVMFRSGPDLSGMKSSGFKPTIPAFNGKQKSFSM